MGDDPEYNPEPTPPPLPPLDDTPRAYSGCCLALSTPLLAHLSTLLPPAPALTLSIGSGYGLLEAILLAPPYNLNIFGVEVQPSSNKYLPAAQHRAVAGTRCLEPLAPQAKVWLFVYPKRVGLVEEYLREYGGEVVVWVGPAADWEDYRGCFERWRVSARSADEVGGTAWELIAIAKRRDEEVPHVGTNP